ncbi:MAG: hypothetical protein ABFC94_04620 [Syntrophomonas sp.]
MSPQTLLITMSHEIGIEKSQFESEYEWTQRVILSACSAWFLNMLRGSEGSNFSIFRIKNKIYEKLSAYLELFSLTTEFTTNLMEDIVEYIFNTHALAGSFYHYPNYICPATEKFNVAFGVKWVRSPIISRKYIYSGLGTYSLCEDKKDEEEILNGSLYATYGLPPKKPAEIMEKIVKRSQWRPLNGSSTREFLHVFRRFGDGYYTTNKPSTHDVLLSREQSDHSYRYILVNNKAQYDLQSWEQEESYHEYIALALINKYQQLQANVTIDDKLINLELNYTLPNPEESFLRLYAWPFSLKELENRWRFSIAPAIYPAIKHRLCHLGFVLKEECL